MADELHYDKQWDEEKNVGKFKHWRADTHSIHRNSNSAYSHYTQAHKTKIADAPRWPAEEALHSNVHPKRPDEEGSLKTLPKNKWWANSKAQPTATPVSERQARGVHVSTWAEAWQIPTSQDPHDSTGRRRYTITSAGKTPIPGAPSRYYATGSGLQGGSTRTHGSTTRQGTSKATRLG